MGGFFEWVLESSLLVLLILAIRKIFMGKIRYVGIYALWLVVLARFLVPFNVVSTPFSVGNFVSDIFSSQETQEEKEKRGTKISYLEENLNRNVDMGGITGTGTIGDDAGKSLQPEQTEKAADETQTETALNTESTSMWQVYAGRLWFVISCILLLWLVMSNVNLNRRMKRSRILYGTREKLNIYLVPGIKTPCLYGFFRPAVYLPVTLAAGESGAVADKEEIGQMITHEYVHYCHGDHIWAMLRILLVSVYWFHPCLWLAVSCSKKDAELACDETVIERLGDRKRFDYGEMLVRLAADVSWGDFRYSLLSMSRKGKEMEKRILAISKRRKYSKWIFIPLVLVVSAAVGLTFSSGVGPSAREQKVEERVTEEKKAINGRMLFEMKQPGLQASNSQMTFYGDFSMQEKAQQAHTCKEAFLHYIEVFTEAVNTGKTDKMSLVLAEGSKVYEQQCALVKNYYKRGIREEIESCSVASAKEISSNQVEIDSKENIKVFYADASNKLIRQTYRYTCELINGTWIITKMDEIPLGSSNYSNTKEEYKVDSQKEYSLLK